MGDQRCKSLGATAPRNRNETYFQGFHMQENHQVLKRTEAELTVQPASMFSLARAHNEGKDVAAATAWEVCGELVGMVFFPPL